MKRQITIYESAQNGKLTVFNDVECNTLSELKALLSEKGINYNGMEFIEGVTNTKLLSDESRIPDNIPFKGKTTNNVFINILQKDQKIKSGVDYSELSRSELLALAKPYAEDIKEIYNRSYTQVSSDALVSFLKDVDEEEGYYEDEGCKCSPREIAITEEESARNTEENIVKAILRIAKHTGVDVSDLVHYTEKSFFSKEDIYNFLSK